MSRLKAIFFDLDHTLWDFETNANATLRELYLELDLESKLKVGVEEFLAHYHTVNENLWSKYQVGKLTSQQLRNYRFRIAFEKYGYVNDKLNKKLNVAYMERCPVRSALFPGAVDLLNDLKERYPLFLITNGFEETQNIKLKSSNLESYFSSMITSETAGVKKPHPNIYRKALRIAKVEPQEAIMLGDDLVADVIGARNAGIRSVWFNPKGKQTKDDNVVSIEKLLDFHQHLEF